MNGSFTPKKRPIFCTQLSEPNELITQPFNNQRFGARKTSIEKKILTGKEIFSVNYYYENNNVRFPLTKLNLLSRS